MTAFVAPWLLEGAIRWRVALTHEASVPRSPFAIREGLYTGAIPPHARVWGMSVEEGTDSCPPIQDWPLVGSVPAFAGVLRVRGLPLGPVDGARRLAVIAGARQRVRVVDSRAVAPESASAAGERAAPADARPAPVTPVRGGPTAPASVAVRPVGARSAPSPSSGPVPASSWPAGPRAVRGPDGPPPQVKLLGGAAPRRPLPPGLLLGGSVGLVALLVAWFLSR